MSEPIINLTDEQKIHFEALSKNEQSKFLANFSKAETPEAQKEAISNMSEIYNTNQKENETREKLGLEPIDKSDETTEDDTYTTIAGIFALPVLYVIAFIMTGILSLGKEDFAIVTAIWLSAILIASTPFFYYKKENAILTKAIIWLEYIFATPHIATYSTDLLGYTNKLSDTVVNYYSNFYHLFF